MSWPARCWLLTLLALLAGPAQAEGDPSSAAAVTAASAESVVMDEPVANLVSGLDIYQAFSDGLADGECASTGQQARWRNHFKQAPGRLAQGDADLLPLFGYVVQALRDADLPTEYALIPFVESGYRPGIRSASGPAGLWQFIALTARSHGVPVEAGYDGRLSPVDSTRAAVRYLKTLHGMFGGDWRLAVMAYNAGEYRVLQSMRRAGMNARNANPAALPGLSNITYSYVQKIQALSCLLQQADDRNDWLQRMDRQVPRLSAQVLPADTRQLGEWASANQHDPALLARLNPALVQRIPAGKRPMQVLAPTPAGGPVAAVGTAAEKRNDSSETVVDTVQASAATGARSHTVSRGESAWSIAQRYGIKPAQLLASNGLTSSSVLRPGMVLKLDDRSP